MTKRALSYLGSALSSSSREALTDSEEEATAASGVGRPLLKHCLLSAACRSSSSADCLTAQVDSGPTLWCLPGVAVVGEAA